MARPGSKRRTYQEDWLTEIPILGHFFKFIKNHLSAIEKTLKTKKAAEGDIETDSYLGGLITTVSGKSFDTLKLRKRKR